MSATSGTRTPRAASAAPDLGQRVGVGRWSGTVTRTISQPASTSRTICSTVASMSVVAGVVIDCTRIGWLPPTPTSPTRTSRVRRLA